MRLPISEPDLGQHSVPELFALYRSILRELRGRGVVRTENAPAGDYAEFLVATGLGETLAPNSEKSLDVLLSVDDYSVRRAARIPVAAVRAAASFNTHVNGHIVVARSDLFEMPDAVDVTDRLRADTWPATGTDNPPPRSRDRCGCR